MTTPQKLSGWANRWLTQELQALASVGSWAEAIKTFSQMSEVTKEEPVPGAASAAKTASASASSLSSSSSSSLAAEKARSARVFHYTTIISACSKAGQWDASLRAFSHMQHAKVQPNIRTYTALIHACSSGEQLGLALRAWAMMEADGVVPNVFAETALVSAFARAGKWVEAMRTLQEAEQAVFPNQHPNVFTYTAAMDACRRAERADVAVAILDRMKQHGVKGNTVTFTTALHACAKAKNWEAALQVLERMRRERVRLIPFARSCVLESMADAPEEVVARHVSGIVAGGGGGGGGGMDDDDNNSNLMMGHHQVKGRRLSPTEKKLPQEILDQIQDPRPEPKSSEKK